nr:EOG090X09DZ [Sida crystallina]
MLWDELDKSGNVAMQMSSAAQQTNRRTEMAAPLANIVDSTLTTFQNATNKPEKFLSIQDEASHQFKKITKTLYDFGKTYHTISVPNGGLPELYIEGFEEEQIWQQMELYNDPAFNTLMKNVSKILAQGKKLSFKVTQFQKDDEGEAEELDADQEDAQSVSSQLSFEISEDSEDDNDSDVDETDELKFDEFKVLDDDYVDKTTKKSGTGAPKKHQKTPVDDQFFKLREMEEFLQKEEQQEGKEKPSEQDDDIDLFDDIPSEEDEPEEDGKTAKYSDFFQSDDDGAATKRRSKTFTEDEDFGDGDLEDEEETGDEDDDKEPKEKRVKFDLDESEAEDSQSEGEDGAPSDSAVKSSFESRQERLRAKIADFEEEALQPKSWQMMGESKAATRPQNALLEEDLVVEHTTRQAPVITEETTRTLEDIIRQRIKDQAFDDVVRKVKPVQDPTEYKKQLILDQQKSKFSLAEIYEQFF